ncbi:MAG: DJ-1/PfpI family protein [Henriciella sp.]|nr:DJ-1/PfpI family protein [Henriciella sp.]
MTTQPYRIAFLIYPGLTQLDFTGPAEVLARMPGAQIATVSTTPASVRSDNGITFVPSATIEDDTAYNMICVPGGFACTDMMANAQVLDWLRAQAETAELVTSVCTGSLILAAAGLLDGYRAGCHWAWIDSLSQFGAIPVRERVVIDRNRITAGGVTAGIDFGFRIIEQRCGRDFAEAIQLGLEYDPAPISGGVPETARPETLAQVSQFNAGKVSERRALIDEIAAKYS